MVHCVYGELNWLWLMSLSSQFLFRTFFLIWGWPLIDTYTVKWNLADRENDWVRTGQNVDRCSCKVRDWWKIEAISLLSMTENSYCTLPDKTDIKKCKGNLQIHVSEFRWRHADFHSDRHLIILFPCAALCIGVGKRGKKIQESLHLATWMSTDPWQTFY